MCDIYLLNDRQNNGFKVRDDNVTYACSYVNNGKATFYKLLTVYYCGKSMICENETIYKIS